MKILFTAFVVTILVSCSTKNSRTIDSILDSSLLGYQISRYEGPKIDINRNSLAQFLTALHYGIPPSEIESALKWESVLLCHY